MINQMHVEESLWWKVAMKRLEKKVQHKRIVNDSFTS